MQRALYGPDGFYAGTASPAAHFRTSVTAAPTVLAERLLVLLDDVDRALGRPEVLDVVDMGAGDGELLAAVAELAGPRVRCTGVDLRGRPDDLPERVAWSSTAPPGATGLVLAHELLDNVPLDLVEVDADGTARLVEVEPASGEERLGAAVGAVGLRWLEQWWPVDGAPPGTRAEIGTSRDAAWAGVLAGVDRGVAVAVDYDHDRATRPALGSLTGYRHGRQVRPVPDGSCDLTAHVALDACAAAGSTYGDHVLVRQRDALRALGLAAGPDERPDRALATTDPVAYVRGLARLGTVAELVDPAGLGGFGWLVQGVRCPVPDRLRRLVGA